MKPLVRHHGRVLEPDRSVRKSWTSPCKAPGASRRLPERFTVARVASVADRLTAASLREEAIREELARFFSDPETDLSDASAWAERDDVRSDQLVLGW